MAITFTAYVMPICAYIGNVSYTGKRYDVPGSAPEGMNDMKNLFARIGRLGFGGSYFDRYYQGVVHSGAGFPTADEARRDYQQVLATRYVPRNM